MTNATVRTAAEYNADPLVSFNMKFRTNDGTLRKTGYVVEWVGGTAQWVSSSAKAGALAREQEPIADDTPLPELLF